MNKLLTLTLAVLLTGSAQASCEWLRRIVMANSNAAAISTAFNNRGIPQANDQAAIIASGFDVQTCFNVAMQNQAFNVLVGMSRNGYLTDSNKAVIGQLMLTNPGQVSNGDLVPFLGSLPVSQRGQYAALAAQVSARSPRNALKPVDSALYIKYQIFQGQTIPCAAMTDQELVGYLLAPETMSVVMATSCRNIICDRAVTLALGRAAGGGTTNGTSKVSVLSQPVVTALNAPMANGLEAALRGLGSSVTNVDRTALSALTDSWLNGTAVSDEQRGKLLIALGQEAFDGWVKTFNK